MRNRSLIGQPLALAALLAAMCGSAIAAEPKVVSGERLAANCAACHGAGGATEGNVLPILAGQPKENLVASMKAFKAGTRPATIMHQISKGYTDEQIELISAWLAAQKK